MHQSESPFPGDLTPVKGSAAQVIASKLGYHGFYEPMVVGFMTHAADPVKDPAAWSGAFANRMKGTVASIEAYRRRYLICTVVTFVTVYQHGILFHSGFERELKRRGCFPPQSLIKQKDVTEQVLLDTVPNLMAVVHESHWCETPLVRSILSDALLKLPR